MDRREFAPDRELVLYPGLVRFFDTYLVQRDIEGTLALMDENVYSIGTGDEEVAWNREEFDGLLRMEVQSIPGPIYYRILEYREMQTCPCTWACVCRMETAVELDNGDKAFYRTRFTGTFRKEEDRFIALSLHMSEGSSYQEYEEFFPLRFISEHARRLNEAAQHELLEILCQVMPGGIIGGYIEEKFPLYVINEVMLQMMGYTYEEFIQATDGLISNSIHDADVELVTRTVLDRLKTEKQYAVEYRLKCKDGSFLWVYDVGRKIKAEDGRDAIISVLVDISENRKTQETLMRESARDYLTGVYNRKGAESLIASSIRQEVPYVFFMIDLDNFKNVNDIYGHNEGDAMLRFTGELLQRLFRRTDVVARIGGDEFAVFAQPCHSTEAVWEKAEQFIREYTAEALERYPLAGTSASVGGVWGICEHSFAELYKLSDQILYEIKHSRKGRCVIRNAD